MEIVLKNKKKECIKTISVSDLESCEMIFEKIMTIQANLEINIFAINEIINSFQLSKFKFKLEKLDISSFHIFSNNRETVLTGKSLKIDSTYINETDLKNNFFLTTSNTKEDIFYKGTVRSGDRIFSNGNLFILGDVNPGAVNQSIIIQK